MDDTADVDKKTICYRPRKEKHVYLLFTRDDVGEAKNGVMRKSKSTRSDQGVESEARADGGVRYYRNLLVPPLLDG